MSEEPRNIKPASAVPAHGPGRNVALERPQDFRGTLRKIIAYLAPYKVSLVFVAIFAIAATLFNVVGPKVLSLATTEIFEGAAAKQAGTGGIDFSFVAYILLATMAVYIVSAICNWAQNWIMASVSQHVSYALRRSIDEKINRMPVAYFESTSTGDVLSRITNDVDTLGQTLSQGITTLVTSVVTLLGVLVMMLLISPLLTVITLVIIPAAVALVSFVVKRSQKYFRAQQHTLGIINGQVEETFSGHVVVRAFGQSKRVVAQFNETNEVLYTSAWKAQCISSLMMPIMNLLSNMAYVVVAIVGGMLAVQRAITVGDIQAFIQYVRNFYQPIQQLSQVANVLQSMAAAAERVFAFLDEEEMSAEVQDTALAQASCNGCIEFDHVQFGYEPGQPVIKDFSARIEAGQTVALVGPTGAGKTTMVKLLMRFYDVDAGEIRLDGTNIANIPREALRDQFAMVLQETWLFSGTIRENIAYGKPGATKEEVETAARAAHAHWFITTLPGGYDMEINEDATNISAGQRQLITIARAILADRRMLILDEATSSVDTRTEELIQQAMDTLMEGRTSFVIAHRLSTIRNADLILCMKDGDIVEQGTHEQLLALGGFYTELYNSQFNE